VKRWIVVAVALILIGGFSMVPVNAATDLGCDYNGDGKADLAFGWPQRTSFTGRVVELSGSSSGLGSPAVWSRSTEGIKGSDSYLFGSALTCGDFDGDGRDDLAVGNGDDFGANDLNVIYGSSTGLTAVGDQLFNQESFRCPRNLRCRRLQHLPRRR